MKSYLLFAALFFVMGQMSAQVYIETGPPLNPKDAFSSINVYGSDGLTRGIPYSRIKGSPFWSDVWHPAVLLDNKDTAFGMFMVKMNLAAQEIHFLDKNGKESVPGSGLVRKIIFYDPKDSSRVVTVFRNNIPTVRELTRLKDYYVQELNQGHVQLLKITIREVKSEDSLFGTAKRYFFADRFEYFLQIGEKTESVKKLNKTEVLSFLPGASAYEAWIREKGLRFNREKDCILFIEHYNATHSSQ